MTQALSPNAPLIGQAGSRYRLDTPALLIDLDALERNIAAMAAHARAVSVALRPHAKTHKSDRIARMQVDAGAIGICCATLGEAEVMVDAGLPGVHVTSPQVTPPKIARLIALNLRAHRGLSVVVDYPENLGGARPSGAGGGKPARCSGRFLGRTSSHRLRYGGRPRSVGKRRGGGRRADVSRRSILLRQSPAHSRSCRAPCQGVGAARSAPGHDRALARRRS